MSDSAKYKHILDLAQKKRGYEVITLGEVNGLPIVLVKPKVLVKNKANVLITAAVHGDEPSGALAIEKVLENSFYNPAFVNVSFIPVINPTGFIANTRYNYKKETTNWVFNAETKKLCPSEEGKILLRHDDLLAFLAKDCHLSLHENGDLKEQFYLYANSYPKGDYDIEKRNKTLKSLVVQSGLRHFSIRPNGVYKDETIYSGAENYKIENGICANLRDGSYEDYMARVLGSPLVMTFETPAKDPENKDRRVRAHLDAMQSVVFHLSYEGPPKVVINLPTVKQTTMNSCGGACVHSIFKYYGSDMPEHKINRLVKVRREGADPENIVSMAREFGMESEYLINQDLQTLLEYVGKGIPCIVAVVAWGNEEKDYSNKKKDGHYIIAIGYDSTKIYFEDPVMLHGKGYMSLYDFLHRWHDLDGDGIIVTIHKPGAKPGAKPVVSEKPSDFFCIP